MGDWRTIETAPRDGTKVILGWPADGYRNAKIVIGVFGGQAWPSHHGVRAQFWMPMPKPPELPNG